MTSDQIFVVLTPGEPFDRADFVGPFPDLESAGKFIESAEVKDWLAGERNAFGGYPAARITTPFTPASWASALELESA